MIRASSLRLAAVLASAALLSGPALAQQSTQQTRGGTSAKKPQQTQSGQRNGAKGAQQKPGNAAQAKPGGAPGGSSQPTLVASFQDWGAHVSGQGRSKVCYAVSEPKDRLPKDLKRDPAYLFVSFRPTEKMKQEVAVRMGFATNEARQAEVSIGQATYALLTKGTDAWIKDQSEESRLVADMLRGQTLTVKATSGRGNATTDRYSLSGFSQAWERVRRECQ